MNKKVKGLVFDFNGTLIFDEELHIEAWQAFSMKYFNRTFSNEEFIKNMFGRTNQGLIDYFFQKKASREEVLKYGEEKERLYRRLIEEGNYKLIEGVYETFDKLKQMDIPMAIATSSPESNVDFYLDYFGIDKWFSKDNIIFDDGTIEGKPSPDLFNKAISKLGIPAENCLILEDSMSGLLAAQSANAGFIIRVVDPQTKHSFESPDYVISEISSLSNFTEQFL